MSPHDKCAFCGGELTTVGCVNFACSSKVTAQLLWVNPNHHADVREEVAQLRTRLATVTAEMESYKRAAQINADAREDERAAHAETRKALECERHNLWQAVDAGTRLVDDRESTRKGLEEAAHDRDFFDSERQREIADLESTRAALARSEARVKELEHDLREFKALAGYVEVKRG